jgi:hypothetical protein
MTDGKYRKIDADRGGVVEMATYASRADLTDGWYGLHECPSMVAPDGSRGTNPYAVSTPHADPEYF